MSLGTKKIKKSRSRSRSRSRKGEKPSNSKKIKGPNLNLKERWKSIKNNTIKANNSKTNGGKVKSNPTNNTSKAKSLKGKAKTRKNSKTPRRNVLPKKKTKKKAEQQQPRKSYESSIIPEPANEIPITEWKNIKRGASLLYMKDDNIVKPGGYLSGNKEKNGEWFFFFKPSQSSEVIWKVKHTSIKKIWYRYSVDERGVSTPTPNIMPVDVITGETTYTLPITQPTPINTMPTTTMPTTTMPTTTMPTTTMPINNNNSIQQSISSKYYEAELQIENLKIKIGNLENDNKKLKNDIKQIGSILEKIVNINIIKRAFETS